MPQFIVSFPADDEDVWKSATDADQQSVYDADAAFVARLRTLGGSILGGAALTHSREARTLRRGPDGPTVSPGTSTPGPAQLSGFFIVDCPDRDSLVDAASPLLDGHSVVEVRPVAED